MYLLLSQRVIFFHSISCLTAMGPLGPQLSNNKTVQQSNESSSGFLVQNNKLHNYYIRKCKCDVCFFGKPS